MTASASHKPGGALWVIQIYDPLYAT
ncbi:hypothetical protein BCEP4_320127 [Burkholderia cepacia]|nr:hypothetical protein BCEP4_320127 [Burkholderia cepacia]